MVFIQIVNLEIVLVRFLGLWMSLKAIDYITIKCFIICEI